MSLATAETATAVARIATYRLQFTPAFGFRAARAVLPYLRDLGISHLYASPIARATCGSQHGYDVCDPREVNPDLGTYDDLVALLKEVRAHGMGWIQDIVPNHLAMCPHNPFLWDVLTFGQRSRWAFLFDIDWTLPDFPGRILLPILGDSYAHLLQAGAFRLTWDAGPVLAYGDHRLPLAPATVVPLLEQADAPTELCASLMAAGCETDPGQRAVFLESVLHRTPEEERLLAERLERIQDPAEIDDVLQRQAWQVAWWRTGREVIGYRRFFAVDSLIAVRCEDERAFNLMHSLVFDLYDQGLISGVRVDHIDGLRDPRAYLERLRARLPDAWILVEKILAHGETLPDWPVDGTTGYEVVNALTGLCCDAQAEGWFSGLHQRFTGASGNPAALATRLRQDIDRLGLGGDLDRTVRTLRATAHDMPAVRDLGPRALREALAALLAAFPVYRTYIGPAGGTAHDHDVLMQARAEARRDHPDLAPVIDAITAVCDLALAPGAPPSVVEAVQRIQQLSGPVMAKGWEDTFLYRWSRCLALNEVGGDPRRFGGDIAAFLQLMATRAPRGGLNATSTHDTKRGEDVRMRLAALTWRPEAWERLVDEAESATAGQYRKSDGTVAPVAEDRYHIYQTLVGTWPVDGHIDAGYRERLHAYALKAVREAGSSTCWTKPDSAYEEALRHWLDALLGDPASAALRGRLTALVAAIAPHAAALALVQTAVKCTIPGVPDIYQGAEWHDFSLVDPDNRRPVDFVPRMVALADPLLTNPLTDQRTKQALLAACLRVRRERPEPWEEGILQPLALAGRRDGILAFARVAGQRVAVVVANLRPEPPSPHLEVILDPTWGRRIWRDAFTGRHTEAKPHLPVAPLLELLPCALLLPE
jgi:(1->4)-alpha-D-glucan 1-alpha-D-glucosylmutase